MFIIQNGKIMSLIVFWPEGIGIDIQILYLGLGVNKIDVSMCSDVIIKLS